MKLWIMLGTMAGAAALAMMGCGAQPDADPAPQEAVHPAAPEQSAESESSVAEPTVEIESEMANTQTEPSAPSAAERIMEIESEMANAEMESSHETAPDQSETRKSPIKIVPTRPMFQSESEFEDPDPAYDTEPAGDPRDERNEDEERREDAGPRITQRHINFLKEQQSLYIIQDFMPVRGVLIDEYYQGRTEYQVWEWASSDGKGGETLVRIRFMDEEAQNIAVNPGPYVLMR